MLTKELIRLLQEADPSGEIECCVDNEDIFLVERLPAYYDGKLEVLIRDHNIFGYNVIGAKILRSGEKIKIRTLSLEDAIYNEAELFVEVPDDYKPMIEEWRKFARELKEKYKDV